MSRSSLRALPEVFRRTSIILLLLLCSACDENDDPQTAHGTSQPSQADILQGRQIAAEASGTDTPSGNSAGTSARDLSELGGNAAQNQNMLRQRFGLSNPSPEMLASWQQYDARLTEYSNKDADWPYPTAAAGNWVGSTASNGDPLAVEGTTVSVDFSRIPRGSLIYIPALNMYAEANDTGATGLWSRSDAGQSDYGPSGAGRVDVYNFADDRSSNQVERDFSHAVGSNEYGKIYVVHPGPGWKH
jgi:hypothetical protein